MGLTSMTLELRAGWRDLCGGDPVLRHKLICLLVWLPAVAQAQLDYTTNNGTITITGYTGPGGAVIIPGSINGLPVTTIGDNAFSVSPTLTSIAIPNSVTSIGQAAFMNCSLTNVTIPGTVTNIGVLAFDSITLTNIAVDPHNSFYSSVAGVLFDKTQTRLIQFPAGVAGSYIIPNNVTSVAEGAFYDCYSLTDVSIPESVTDLGPFAFNACTNLGAVTIGAGVTAIEAAAFSQCSSLTNLALGNSLVSIGASAFYACIGLTSLTIPSQVTSIGQQAFDSCVNLTSIYFQGDAPSLGALAFSSDPATVYYLPGTSGWGSTFGGLPTQLWTLPYPVILSSGFGVQSNQFGFIVSWATNLTVVVEASADLVTALWVPLETNSLSLGWFNFTDLQWTNYPRRFYRVSSY